MGRRGSVLRSRDDCDVCSPCNWSCRQTAVAFLGLVSVVYIVLASLTAANVDEYKLYATDKQTAKDAAASASPSPSPSPSPPPPPSTSPSPTPTTANEVTNSNPSSTEVAAASPTIPGTMANLRPDLGPVDTNEINSGSSGGSDDEIDGFEKIDFTGFKIALSFSITAVMAAFSCSFVDAFTDWGGEKGREILHGMELVAQVYTLVIMIIMGTLLMKTNEVVHLDDDHSVYMQYVGTWIAAYTMTAVYGVFLGYQIWQMYEDATAEMRHKYRQDP